MVNSGLHLSMNQSPNMSMLQRAGGGSKPSRKKDHAINFCHPGTGRCSNYHSLRLSSRVPPAPSRTEKPAQQEKLNNSLNSS